MLNESQYRRLGRLLNALHQCMDIKFALMGLDACEVYTSACQTPFCRALAAIPGGHERCLQCDRQALGDIRATQKMKQYYCHAGLIEIALPVTENGEIIAMIVFGQVLDDGPREAQWQRVRRALAWHPGAEELYQPFLQLKRVSAAQIAACAEIVHACVSEARLMGIVAAAEQDEAQRLLAYVDSNYAAPLRVEAICASLGIGKNRLYRLCRARFGKTPVQLVNERRVEAARELLLTTGHSVQYIAETVGVADFNYFTRLFRSMQGLTPSQYRKRGQPG